MDLRNIIDIIVFPEFEETEGESVGARLDAAQDISIISKSVLDRLDIVYQKCHGRLVTDSYKTVHPYVGKVDLRWYQKDKAKSFRETFYVVESLSPSVILGARAIQEASMYKEQEIRPLGLRKQTTEEKMQQEQRKVEAERRRAIEKREQEEREAQNRREASEIKEVNSSSNR